MTIFQLYKSQKIAKTGHVSMNQLDVDHYLSQGPDMGATTELYMTFVLFICEFCFPSYCGGLDGVLDHGRPHWFLLGSVHICTRFPQFKS